MYLTTRSYPLRDPVSRLFNDVLGLAEWPIRGATAWVPSVDVLEQKDSIRIMAELPGVKPEDVKISLLDDVLTVSGTKQQAAFERAFTLPATVQADAIKATYENGVLTVTLPKEERAKPRQIPVEVSKS